MAVAQGMVGALLDEDAHRRIVQALLSPSDQEACKRFCTEAMQTGRRWGPPEQRVLFEQLPVLMNRFYQWLSDKTPATEEALVRTFHPNGPLATHLSAWGAPAFLFPVQRLPPIVMRAATLSATDWFGARYVPGARVSLDRGSAWFQLLGSSRVSRTPTAGLEGISLTAQEFMLTCFIHYLVCDARQFPRTQAAGGRLGVLGGFGGGVGGAGAISDQMSMGQIGGGLSGAGNLLLQQAGQISIAFERLLWEYLDAYLPHSVYEKPYAEESVLSRFFLFLLREFLLSPQVPEQTTKNTSQEYGRFRPGSLHAARVIALHVLSNPALKSSCEEYGGRDGHAWLGRGVARRLTREVAVLGPGFVDFISDLLRGAAANKQLDLQTLTSLIRLWLVLLQPWKAPRLYTFYRMSRPRPFQPQQPTAQGGTQATNRCVDVNLLGLEPDASLHERGIQALPMAPEGVDMPVVVGGASYLPNLAAAFSPELDQRLQRASAMPLVPGAGDAQTWRSYIASFHGTYCLLEAFLSSPTYIQLCTEVSWRFLQQPKVLLSVAPSLTQPHHIAAMKALAQTLLCFTDPALVRVLVDLSNSSTDSRQDDAAAPILVDGVLHPKVLSLVSLVWAGLLAYKDFYDSRMEFTPLLCAISRQLGQTSLWNGLPSLSEADVHEEFVRRVYSKFRAPSASSTPGVASEPIVPRFVGSEWQRPKRGGEVEILLLLTYWLAVLIDRFLRREFRSIVSTSLPESQWPVVPQTEWPRLFANWKLTFTSAFILLLAVWY